MTAIAAGRSARMRAWERNRKTMRGLGIEKIDWIENKGAAAVHRLTMIDGEEVRVEVPVFGSTEATVLAKAAQMLKDRPVRYA